MEGQNKMNFYLTFKNIMYNNGMSNTTTHTIFHEYYI